MKKSLLLGLLSSVLVLAACGNKEETPPEPVNTNVETNQEALPTNEALLPTNNEITMTCPEAIQAYLNDANLQGEGDITVQANDAIVVDYIGRLEDGSVFDTSVESVAKACGSYTAGRDYTEGLAFTAGAAQMIPGFDAAVIGMKVNQTKTVTLSPAEAYGERDENAVEIVSKESLKDFADAGIALEVGSKLPTMYGELPIIAVEGENVTIDLNAPLAGKSLIFDITIKSIN